MTIKRSAAKDMFGFGTRRAVRARAGSQGLLLAAILSTVLLPSAAAQQREFINPSFENGPTFPQATPPSFVITDDTNVTGWRSSNGDIELWRQGFQNRSAQDGVILAELNPSAPVALFQEVCLFNGETVTWDFYHSARSPAPASQMIEFQVANTAGSLLQVLDDNEVNPVGNNSDQTMNPWMNVEGNEVYTGPTGVQRLQFISLNAGSNGNFLDDINVQLVPLISLSPQVTSAFEGAATPAFPAIIITGELQSDATVTFSTSGTATLGADYTLGANTVIIPAGSYTGDSFQLPVTINTDTVLDDGETIIFTIDSVTTAVPGTAPNLTSSVGVCDNATLPQATHTILDTPPVIEALEESYPSVNGADGATLPSILGADMLNGAPVDPTTVDLTIDSVLGPDGNPTTAISVDPATGEVTVPAGTPAGDYMVTYTICDPVNPANCETVTETITVTQPLIEALPETYPPVDGTTGGTLPSILGADMLNGAPVDPTTVDLTIDSVLGPDGNPTTAISVDPLTGEVTVPAGTPTGDYMVTYTICDPVSYTHLTLPTKRIV